MVKIIDIAWNEKEIECIACSIQKWIVDLPIERITETEHFVLEQDFEWPIEWFLIIASKRHVHSLLEFSNEEYKDYSELLIKSRKLLQEALGIKHVTMIQEEYSSTSHFHTWLFPWYDWMKESVWGKLQDIKNIMKYAKLNHSSKDHLQKIKNASKKLKDVYNKILIDTPKKKSQWVYSSSCSKETNLPHPFLRWKYQHYKGNLYEVIDLVRHSETLEELVLYRALYESKEFGTDALWVRPATMFFENVVINGKETPRFQYVWI